MRTLGRCLKKNLLFVCYGAGHAEIVIPLYNEALKRDFNPRVLALTTAYKKMADLNIDCISLNSLLKLFPSEALDIGQILAAGIPKNDLVPLPETIAYLGLGYWDLKTKFGPNVAEQKYKELGRKAFCQTLVAEKILEHLKTDICITTSSPRMEEAFIKSSKKLGVSCYMVLENFNLPDYQGKFCHNDYADLVFCSNQKNKDLLTGMGRSSEDLIVSGNPAFEKNTTPEALSSGKSFRSQHIDTYSKIIVFAMAPQSSRFYEFDKAIFNKLIKETAALNYKLILRPHPSDLDFKLQETFDHVLISSKEPINQLLNSCDVLVTQVSTVGQEAHQMGIQTIHVLSESLNETHGYSYEGFGKKIIGLKTSILDNKINTVADDFNNKGVSPSIIIFNTVDERTSCKTN